MNLHEVASRERAENETFASKSDECTIYKGALTPYVEAAAQLHNYDMFHMRLGTRSPCKTLERNIFLLAFLLHSNSLSFLFISPMDFNIWSASWFSSPMAFKRRPLVVLLSLSSRVCTCLCMSFLMDIALICM